MDVSKLKTGKSLSRHDTKGVLYLPIHHTPPSSSCLATCLSDLWHNNPNHPSSHVIDYFCVCSFISYNIHKKSSVLHSCQVENNKQSSFYDSNSFNFEPF